MDATAVGRPDRHRHGEAVVGPIAQPGRLGYELVERRHDEVRELDLGNGLQALRRLGLRLRVGFQLFIALLATGIGIGLVVMVRDAVTSRSVVIDPFDAPPALAASGLSGKVVAEFKGNTVESDVKFWMSKSVPLSGLVKMDLKSDFANVRMEVSGSGSEK